MLRKKISEKVEELKKQEAEESNKYNDDADEAVLKFKSRRGVPGDMTAVEHAELARDAKGCARLRKKRKLAELDVEERKQIVNEYLEQNILQREIAARHQVTCKLVSNLVVAAEKDPDWADALELKAVKQRRLENMIVIGT